MCLCRVISFSGPWGFHHRFWQFIASVHNFQSFSVTKHECGMNRNLGISSSCFGATRSLRAFWVCQLQTVNTSVLTQLCSPGTLQQLHWGSSHHKSTRASSEEFVTLYNSSKEELLPCLSTHVCLWSLGRWIKANSRASSILSRTKAPDKIITFVFA